MDIWGTLKPYLVLAASPLAFTFPATIGLWLLLGQPVPEALILPVALLLAPPLWFGLLFMIFLSRYSLSLGRLYPVKPDLYKASGRALRRLDLAYVMREWLARHHLRGAVYLGYFLKYLQLNTESTVHPLNPYRGDAEEQAKDARRQQQVLLCSISRFVYVTGVSGRSSDDPANALLDCLTLIRPSPCREFIETLILNTYSDGPGFLSTLTALTYSHFLLGLPPKARGHLEIALNKLQFDMNLYGWLSNRVLEAVIYLGVQGQRSSADIVGVLQPVLDRTTDQIEAAMGDDEVLKAKYEGRRALREVSECRSRT